MTRSRLLTALLFAIALPYAGACSATTVDVTGLPETDDYTSWDSFTTYGPVPGHGDTYRVIYTNFLARYYDHAGRYPLGSVIVKEVYENDDGNPGDLRYVAIMRKLDQAPADADLQGGWLFTMASEPGAEETFDTGCWERCHAQAPVDGAWFDYGR